MLSDTPATIASCFGPAAVFTRPAMRGGNIACISRGSLSVLYFHFNVRFFTLATVRRCSSFCHAVRCGFPPSVSQFASAAFPCASTRPGWPGPHRAVTTTSATTAGSIDVRFTAGGEIVAQRPGYCSDQAAPSQVFHQRAGAEGPRRNLVGMVDRIKQCAEPGREDRHDVPDLMREALAGLQSIFGWREHGPQEEH